MTTQSKLLTAEDLWNLPEDGFRHELVRGKLTSMTPPGGAQGAVVSLIAMRLSQLVWAQRLGAVVAGDAGFILRRAPDTVRGPDVAFVAFDRLAGGRLPDGYFEGAPAIAVEVVSPNDRPAEVQAKVGEWLAAGARQVWVAYPATRTLVVHGTGFTAQLTENDTLTGGDVLPGFCCPVRDLFPPS